MTVLPMMTGDQRAIAAIAQAVLEVDAGRRPGWQLDRWGLGNIRASGRAPARVVKVLVQRTGPTVHAVVLYRRGDQVRAMSLTVRAGRVLHLEMLEDGRGLRRALPDPLRRLRTELDRLDTEVAA